MMRTNCIVLSLLLFVSCSLLDNPNEREALFNVDEQSYSKVSVDSSNVFYYYFDEKIPLTPRTDMVLAQFVDSESKELFITKNRSLFYDLALPIGKETEMMNDGSDFVVMDCSSNTGINSVISKIKDCSEVVFCSSFFDCRGAKVAPTNDIAVKLKHDVLLEELAKIIDYFHGFIYTKKNFPQGTYFVKIPIKATIDPITLANLVYESGLVEFATPDFIQIGDLFSNDSYFDYQWSLKNTGQLLNVPRPDTNIEQAWYITEGSQSIKTAVFDCGIEFNHPDLAQNMVGGYDAYYAKTNIPFQYNDKHGTAVAGIISAKKDNGIGISGIAPQCKLMSVRMFSDYFFDSVIADAFEWAWQNGADVINCSWGIVPSALVTSSINHATTNGRNGKGCVVVCSSGNSYNGVENSVAYPACLDNVLAVGAISFNGMRQSFSSPINNYWSSNYGSTLDVVAPGTFIATTDRIGDLGYNNTESNGDFEDMSYTYYFDGTSSSAPIVSGIAALMLSAYPDLSQEMVRRAIELACVRLPSYSFAEDSKYPSSFRNNEIGYGLIQADYAMEEAANMNRILEIDTTPGLDFTIINDSSIEINDVMIQVEGLINGQYSTLISCDLLNSIYPGKQAGYPIYRGYALDIVQNTPVTNMILSINANVNDAQLRVGYAYDTTTVNNYEDASLDNGDTYERTIDNILISSDFRHRLYIRISD